MRQVISSPWTPIIKFLLVPAIAIGASIQFTMILWFIETPGDDVFWVLWKVGGVISWVVLLYLLYARGWRLVKLVLTDEGIEVSDIFETTSVAYGDIEAVTASRFPFVDFIRVDFRRSARSGERIVCKLRRRSGFIPIAKQMARLLDDLATGQASPEEAEPSLEKILGLAPRVDPAAAVVNYEQYHRARGSTKPPLPK